MQSNKPCFLGSGWGVETEMTSLCPTSVVVQKLVLLMTPFYWNLYKKSINPDVMAFERINFLSVKIRDSEGQFFQEILLGVLLNSWLFHESVITWQSVMQKCLVSFKAKLIRSFRNWVTVLWTVEPFAKFYTCSFCAWFGSVFMIKFISEALNPLDRLVSHFF